MFFKLLFTIALSYAVKAAERPRGVSPTKASFYQPDKDFTCLESGEVIPWQFINDDYCDCGDGSDEPGTSACTNGVYFCENKGHRGIYLTSSRVNDGICDCCDGGDEFEGRITCMNRCNEIGRQEREEREKFRQLQEQGYKIKQEYIQQGKRTKDEKRARLSELEKQVTDLKAARDELQSKKDEAEGPEKDAKEKHEKAWEEMKALHQAEKDRAKAELVFAELDINSDNVVDYVELQGHSEFDIDSDGTVSMEEAKEYLEDNEGVNVDTFKDKIYSNIKDIYKSSAETGSEAAPQEQPLPDESMPTPTEGIPDSIPSPDDSGDDEEEGDEEEDDYEDEDEVEEDRGEEEPKAKDDEEQMPPYDAETQKLIDEADAVRKEYNDADSNVRDAENEINGLKKYLDVDHGPDEEYSALRGQCFEFTDREYTYRLCPFEKTIQKPKAGGIETSLGNWGHWYGPEEDKYDAMKYDNGQSCWNGPNRSCHVNLHCGTENKLTGASEPSRCEYQFEFTTPARCKAPQEVPKAHEHEEL